MTDAEEHPERPPRDQQRLRERYAACVSMGLRDEAEQLAAALDISPAELEAHFRAGHHGLGEWQPTDFESFASLPPGRFDPRVLGQTTWWVDILRRPHRITDPDDFTTEHLHAVIAFIRAEAWRWAEPAEFGDDDPVGLAAVLEGLTQQIDDTPLMRVIVTMQTFPFALQAIRGNQGLAGKRFAIIADEAHSSQTGRTSQQLRAVLTAEELNDLEDGGEVDTEAILAAEMEARAESPNLSFFAFTATPKAKTLELFGRADSDGVPRPFHVYTMQQAIEEGYILDVLRNYTTYDTAFRIAERSKKHLEEVKLVDESEATKGLMRWVSLHPTNIAQKVQIIVEHYRANVRHLLDGHAKAMLVTSSREHAVRYKEAIDAYITKRGYGLATLVAFSGSITVDEVAFAAVEPPYTETNLNSGLRGRALPVAFGSGDFQILIVANKYQTGFDQPLLCAMYVDKRLSGVTAVQTLSRLNRTYPAAGKDTTYVLDFVNDPAEILASFQPYYREATLEEETDPDIVHDLQAKLDAAGIYTDAEVEAFVVAYLAGRHGAISAPLKAAADRFNSPYAAAVADSAAATVEELDLFRKDVGSFVRLYDFLSQIVNYADTDLEKRSLFLRLLAARLTGSAGAEATDFSAVELTHIKQARSGDHDLDLDTGEAVTLKPVAATGTGAARDPRMVRLAEVLAKINDLFAGEDFTPAEQQSWVEGLVTVLMDDDLVRAQAGANTKKQFVESPDLSDAVTDAVLSNQTSHNKMPTTSSPTTRSSFSSSNFSASWCTKT